MTEQEQIDALKAQVNCLRKSIRKATVTDMDITEFHNVLQTTPEQCLAKVKAKTIEKAIQLCSSSSNYGDMCEAKCLQFYADQLRRQAK